MKRLTLLTTREKEIFKFLNMGYNTKEIGIILNISEKTVRNHISNVMQKLDCKSRRDAIDVLNKTKLLE